MVFLIDTNVIIRFLVKDNEEQYSKSVEVIKELETGELEAEFLSEVIMEVLFVMTKFYKVALVDIVEDIKELLLLNGIVNKNKYVLIESLNIMLDKNIDYVDALICTKAKLQGYGKISFDKDVMKKCEKE